MSFSVQDTNLEALYSKIAAIKSGYFEDDYALSLIESNIKKDVIISIKPSTSPKSVSTCIYRALPTC